MQWPVLTDDRCWHCTDTCYDFTANCSLTLPRYTVLDNGRRIHDYFGYTAPFFPMVCVIVTGPPQATGPLLPQVGSAFVREEFRRHKTASLEYSVVFLREWRVRVLICNNTLH